MIGRPLTGAIPPRRLGLHVAGLMAGGVTLYYIASIGAAIHLGQAIRAGTTETALTPVWTTLPVIVGALLYALAAGHLLRFVWGTTAVYRADAMAALFHELDRHNAKPKPWRAQVPNSALLLPEALAALFGFPGLGWILAGRALVGVPLMFGGPALAWAVLPLVFSPYSDLGLTGPVYVVIQGYLIVMSPPGLDQDRKNAVTTQAMTNRAQGLPELSGNYRNLCPGITETPVRELLKSVSGNLRNPHRGRARRGGICRPPADRGS